MKPDKTPERDPQFNLRRNETWHRGARVVRSRQAAKPQRNRRGHK
jgi:hypothetical protein